MQNLAVRPGSSASPRPRQRPGCAAFPVANELVLLSPDGEVAHALNESAAGVWRLCDGRHTPLDMLVALRALYDGKNVEILADVTAALFRLHQLGLISVTVPGPDDQGEDASAQPGGQPRVRFLFGVEDRPYFHWQLGILFESLAGQLEPG